MKGVYKTIILEDGNNPPEKILSNVPIDVFEKMVLSKVANGELCNECRHTKLFGYCARHSTSGREYIDKEGGIKIYYQLP